MAEKNLENLKIKNTYERVVQRVDGAYYDGTGSLLDIASSTDIPSTSSLLTTASAEGNVLTFEKGDGSEFDVTITTASLDGYATEAFVNAATGSLLETASVSSNTITFTQGDGSTFDITVDTGSFEPVDTGSLLTTASATDNTITFTKGDASTFDVTITNSTDTGSLLETASVSLNTITFTKGDGSTFPITVDTGSAETVDTGSLLTTASVSLNTITFTKGDGSTFPITVDTGSGEENIWEEVGDGSIYYNLGNVGIGEGAEAPDKELYVSSSEQCVAIFDSSNTGGGIVFKDATTTDDFSVGLGALGDNLCFLVGGTQKHRMLANGNVGINTLNPGATLEVVGNISASAGITGSLLGTASYATFAEDASNANTVAVGNGSSPTTYFLVGATAAGDQQLFRNSGLVYDAQLTQLQSPQIKASSKIFLDTHEIRENLTNDGFLVYLTNWDVQGGNLTLTDGEAIFDGDTTITGSLTVSGAIDFDGPSVNINSDSTIGLIGTDVRTSDLTVISGNDFEIENGDATITGSLIVSGGNVTYGDDDFTYTATGGDEASISITGSLAITGSATGSLTINDAEPVWTTYQSTTVFNNSNTNPQGWNSYSNFDSGLAQYYTKWVAPFKCRVRFVSLFVQGNVSEVTMEAFVNVGNGTNFTTNTPDHTYTLSQTGANQTHHYDWYYDDGETFEVEAGDTIDFALASDGTTNANSCRLQVTFQKVI